MHGKSQSLHMACYAWEITYVGTQSLHMACYAWEITYVGTQSLHMACYAWEIMYVGTQVSLHMVGKIRRYTSVRTYVGTSVPAHDLSQ